MRTKVDSFDDINTRNDREAWNSDFSVFTPQLRRICAAAFFNEILKEAYIE